MEEAKAFVARMQEDHGVGTWRRLNPTHGPCCTCQACGYDHDQCICLELDLQSACDIIDRQAELIKAKDERIAELESSLRMATRTDKEQTQQLKAKEEEMRNYRRMGSKDYAVCGKCKREYHTLSLFDCPHCDEQALKSE